MSIHFYLNFDATLVSVERRTTIKGTKKTNVDRIANLSVDTPISHDELSLEEAQKVQSFVDEQMSLIEKAYLNNSARGFFGGVPAISVVVKLNWPRFYSLASTFSLTRLVSNRRYADAA